MRVKNTDVKRGKSGGYRVIYYLETNEELQLVTIYSKSEQSDVDASDVLRIISEKEG